MAEHEQGQEDAPTEGTEPPRPPRTLADVIAAYEEAQEAERRTTEALQEGVREARRRLVLARTDLVRAFLVADAKYVLCEPSRRLYWLYTSSGTDDATLHTREYVIANEVVLPDELPPLPGPKPAVGRPPKQEAR